MDGEEKRLPIEIALDNIKKSKIDGQGKVRKGAPMEKWAVSGKLDEENFTEGRRRLRRIVEEQPMRGIPKEVQETIGNMYRDLKPSDLPPRDMPE